MSLTGPYLHGHNPADGLTCECCGVAVRHDNSNGRRHNTHRECELALILVNHTMQHAIMYLALDRLKRKGNK